MNGCLDPPERIGQEPRAMTGFEPRRRNHEPKIGFRDQICQRKAASLVASRRLGCEPEMARDECVRGVSTPLLLPMARKLLLLTRFQQIVLADERGIPIEKTSR